MEAVDRLEAVERKAAIKGLDWTLTAVQKHFGVASTKAGAKTRYFVWKAKSHANPKAEWQGAADKNVALKRVFSEVPTIRRQLEPRAHCLAPGILWPRSSPGRTRFVQDPSYTGKAPLGFGDEAVLECPLRSPG